jgi:F-box associated protein
MSFVSGKKRLTESNMSYSNHSKDARGTCSMVVDDGYVPLLPGLLDDVAKLCLALVPRIQIPTMGAVSTRWRSFIRSKEFITIRKLAGTIDEWLYLLIINEESKSSHWEVLDCFGNKHRVLPHMPGGFKMGFGVVVLHGKLLVMAGRTVSEGPMPPTADVYQYDSCLNRYI